MTNSLKTFLWFNVNLDDVLEHYKDVFDLTVHSVFRNETGALFTAEGSIYGHELVFMSVEGGPKFNEAVSLSLGVDGQGEVDRIWDALTEKGEAGKCGWCTDQFGVSWQVTPVQMHQWLQNPDPEISGYAWPKLMGMSKIILDELHL